MPVAIPADEPRSREELEEQYVVERELAARLVEASREARRTLYSQVYDEFLRRVPHQPLARQRDDPAAQGHLVALQSQLLGPFLRPDTVFLEIGSGDSALARHLASRVKRVYAVEACREIVADLELPRNFHLIVADTPPYDLPEERPQLAMSCHFIEHLHPEDALDHAVEVRRRLAPGGHYVCITPNRLYGPHDVSKYFDDEARGLHLREYTHGELGRLLLRAGFGRVEVLAGVGRPPRRLPLSLYRLIEAAFQPLAPAVRRRWLPRLVGRGPGPPLRPLEQVKLLATRAG